MRENGLYSVVLKKYKRYSNMKNLSRYADNIVDRKFAAEEPNKIWVSDITYIKTD